MNNKGGVFLISSATATPLPRLETHYWTAIMRGSSFGIKSALSFLLLRCRSSYRQISDVPNRPIIISRNLLSSPFSRDYSSSRMTPTEKSPFESNILRIVRAHIDSHTQYTPAPQPVTKYNAFIVENRPGEQWITLSGKATEDEHIKIEATMFDGSVLVPNSGRESGGEGVKLHISLLVDIWKGDKDELLEFVCSAWPDSLEIQKVCMFKRDSAPSRAYIGPDIKDLNSALKSGLYDFLKIRGVDDGLSVFLHEYMMNKDKAEHMQWLEKVEEFLER